MTMFEMKRFWVIVAILAVAWLGFGGIASAQTPVVATSQGVLGTVACDGANCTTLTVTVTTPSGTQSFVVSRDATTVWAGNEKVSPTALNNFVGTPVIVLSTQVGSQQVAGRINILVFPASGNVSPAVSGNDGDRHGGDSSAAGGGNQGGGNQGGGNQGGGNNGGGNNGGGNNGGGNNGGGNNGGGNNGGGNHGGGNHGGGNNGGHGGHGDSGENPGNGGSNPGTGNGGSHGTGEH